MSQSDDYERESFRYRLIANLFDNAHVSIWACDRDLRVRLWNKGAEEIYGRTEEEMIGCSYVDLIVDAAERDESIADCHRIIDFGQRYRNFLAYDHHTSGAQVYMLTNCFRIVDPVTGERLQAEIGVEISDLEIQRDRHRTLRELGIARRTEAFIKFAQMKAEVGMRVQRVLEEVEIVKVTVIHDIEVFRESASTRTRCQVEETAQRLRLQIEAEYRSVVMELENLSLRAQVCSDLEGLEVVVDRLGTRTSQWSDRIRDQRPPT